MKDKIIDYVTQTPENTNPAVLNTLLGDLNKQPDWNQNDKTAPDYVKNRPFYEETTEVVMLPETSFEIVRGDAIISDSFPYTFDVGQDYTVTLDGETKTYTAIDYNRIGALCNTSLSDIAAGNGWVIIGDTGQVGLMTLDPSFAGTHTIKIGYPTTTTHKIGSKYIDSGSLGLEPLVIYAKITS